MAVNSTYTSQQADIMASMVAYLQNPANWIDGVPRLTDFTPGSVVFTLLSAVSVAVDALGFAIFQARLAAYITTAIGEDLDAKVADFGLTRNAPVAASGDFTFYRNNPSSVDIGIPAGSLISTVPTEAAPAIVFATDADAQLAHGTTTVKVTATAQEAGKASNISAGAQLLIASMVPGIDGVLLDSSVTNGDDEETDDALRARGLAAFQALAHGTIESYQELVLAVPGISNAIVAPQNRGPGTLDIFIEGPDNSIPSESLKDQAQAAVEVGKVATDDVQVLLPEIITVPAALAIQVADGFDFTSLATLVSTAVQTYIDGLGIGAQPTSGYIYASRLVSAALTVDGVLNATTTFVDTPVPPQQVPVSGTVSVTEI